VAGGFAARLRYAAGIGAEPVQVFVSNPRSWALSGADAGRDRAAADQLAASGLPLFVHTPYLINVGSMDQVIRDRSVVSLHHALRLVHTNDSKDPCGSRRDRHENIGAGQIGEEPFRALLGHPAAAQVPFIIETPARRSRTRRTWPR
jgi:endonuclease IV